MTYVKKKKKILTKRSLKAYTVLVPEAVILLDVKKY